MSMFSMIVSGIMKTNCTLPARILSKVAASQPGTRAAENPSAFSLPSSWFAISTNGTQIRTNDKFVQAAHLPQNQRVGLVYERLTKPRSDIHEHILAVKQESKGLFLEVQELRVTRLGKQL
jgi:hypothetical protein